MCVICIKEANSKLLSKRLITRMGQANPDLCGFSYQLRERVVTYRGLTYQELIKLQPEIPIESIAVYHFRIATSGTINEANSHPFPLHVTRKFSTHTMSKYSLSHNGIFFHGSDTQSDTAMVANTLEHTNLDVWDDWLAYLCAGSTNKLALLTSKTVYTYGAFIKLPEYEGLQFSNDYWRNSYTKSIDNRYANYDYTSSDHKRCLICECLLVGNEYKTGFCYKCQKLATCEGCGAELNSDEYIETRYTEFMSCETCRTYNVYKIPQDDTLDD